MGIEASTHFPAWLHHPAFTPAVNSGPNEPPGKPARFPPVLVHNDQQIAEYQAKGYTLAADLIPLPVSHEIDPEHEYPKWVRNILCQNREQEDNVLNSTVESIAASPEPSLPRIPSALEDQLRDALVARATAAGIEINISASVEEIRAEVQRRVMGS